MLRLFQKSPVGIIRTTKDRIGLYLVNNSWRYSGENATVRLKVIPAPPTVLQTYDKRGGLLQRAMSPHLTIYKPQLTSLMSISLRMSGCALTGMLWMLGVTMFISDQNADYFIQEAEKLDVRDWFWCLSRFAIAFPFSFHLCNGLRHLAFLTCSFMEIKQVYSTGYIVAALSILVAFILVCIEDIKGATPQEKAVEQGDNKKK